MPTQTYNNWPDPEIKYEGVHVQLESRPRKKVKKYSFLHCTGKLIAFLVIIAVAGNVIEYLARL
jgi:hypothetical protein